MDDAIADLLCLKTHYHGTSPKAYRSIMNQGADPGYGGKGGESRFYKVIGKDRELNPSDNQGWNCNNRFFVCLTQEAIPTHHIGFFGSLNHGLNSEWFGRLKSNPMSFTFGLLKLILISSIIGLTIFATMNMPIFGLALGAYIAFCGVQAIARLVVPQSYKPENSSRPSTQTLASTTIVLKANETNEDEVTSPNTMIPNAFSI